MSVTLEQVLALRYRGSTPTNGRGEVSESTGIDPKLASSLEQLHLSTARSLRERASVISTGSFEGVSPATAIPVLHADYFVKLLMAMRSEAGVRLANVERNLYVGWGQFRPILEEEEESKGHDEHHHAIPLIPRRGAAGRFAFNSLQWAVLPMLYRPPMRCIGGSLT